MGRAAAGVPYLFRKKDRAGRCTRFYRTLFGDGRGIRNETVRICCPAFCAEFRYFMNKKLKLIPFFHEIGVPLRANEILQIMAIHKLKIFHAVVPVTWPRRSLRISGSIWAIPRFWSSATANSSPRLTKASGDAPFLSCSRPSRLQTI